MLARFFFSACLASLAVGQIATTGLSGGDEFTGPFPSWANIRNMGAAGDGVADDTLVFQNALNNLGQAGNPFVLYVPSGTYRITAGLTINSPRQGISIIGQDPATTILKWDGPVGGEMLYLNAVAIAKFSRITWDGAGTHGNQALTAIDYGWDGLGMFGGSTYNENSDEVFKNFGYGIRGGSKGFMDAENSILRCKFIGNTRAGISVENYNALDWYIWDSTFTGNVIGITNNQNGTGGHFHVYGSLFQGSTVADILIGPTSYFSIRQNYSMGSNAFLSVVATGSASADITLQSNTVLDAATTPIIVRNPGTVLMFDNTIRMKAGLTDPVVTVQDTSSGTPAGFVALGNTLGYSGAVTNWYGVPAGAGNVASNIVDLDNQVVASSTMNPAIPTMPGALPNLNRQVFEAPAATNADAIQQAIDAAVAFNGQRPVVHLPAGTYSIDHTVVIPVGSDVQLVGDGGGPNAATTLQWVGGGTGPVLRLAGPSRAVLRDFNIQGAGQSTGILVENTDQASGRVFMEQMNAQRQTGTGVFVNGLDNAEVILHDAYIVTNNTGLQVTGGPKSVAGQAVTARTNSFAALTAANTLTYNVSNRGRLMSQDVWYEGAPAQLVNFAGSGTFTLHGAEVAAQDPNHGGVQSAIPTFQVNGFNGPVSVLAAQFAIRNTIAVQGNGSNTSLLALGILGPPDNANFFVNSTSPAAQVAMLGSRQATNTGSVPVADVTSNIGSTPAFLRQMVAQTRQEQAHALTVPASGNTDVRFYRVSVDQGQAGVQLDAGGPTSTSAPVISAVVSSVNNTSATITWTTNEAADSRVRYGTSAAYGSSSTLDGTAVTSHSVTLNGLLAGTQYHFTVASRSLSGYVAASADFTFATPGNSTPTSFVNNFTPGSLRNNFSGWIGMKFTTGVAVPVVTALGRVFVTGNTGTHTVKIVRASDGGDAPGASIPVPISGGAAGAFTYAQLPTPVSLAANTSYYLVSQEVQGGDQWYDISPLTTSAIATLEGPEYLSNNSWVLAPPKNNAYVPVDFKYVIAPSDTVPPAVSIVSPAAGTSVQGTSVAVSATATDNVGIASVQFRLDGNDLGSPIFSPPYSLTWSTLILAAGPHTLTALARDAAGNTTVSAPVTVTVSNPGSGLPLITSFNLNTLRNNFSGWVGMQFTVGASPLTVSTLGRAYIAGNTGTHVVKLVKVSDGTDVPGATVTIALASGTAGQFAYAALASPVILPAGTAYYLVSQETLGGDQWYDGGAITAANVVAANGQVYFAGGWVLVPATANASYVPVSLQYTISGASPPTVTITSPSANATLTGNATLSALATPTGGATIANVQFRVDNANVGAPLFTSPYNLTLDTTKLSNGTHTLTAVATDSNGAVGTSAAITVTVSTVVPPSVSVTTPANGAGVTGSIAITATAIAFTGLTIANVQFKVDGSPLGPVQTASPYSVVLDTGAYANGTHILTAIATDSAGNTGTSAPITITSNNNNAPGPFILPLTNPVPALRNNFSGFVGLQFTVGNLPVTVYALGRIYLSGNLGSHTLKLVKASDGTDVPGASVPVLGGTPGQFTYGQLASPVILPANTAYYLLSLESNGGDQWYDYGPLTFTSAATIQGPAYSNGLGGYTTPDNPNNGFVPVNLLYKSPSASTTVAITAPASNTTVSGNVTVSANATAGFGLTLNSVQFQVDGANQGAAVTASPYSIILDTTKLNSGVHSVSAVAKDSGNNSTLSAAVTFTVNNPGAAAPLLIGSPSGAARNNYTGWVGTQFTVGASAISVSSLGRVYLSGNTGTHIVKLARVSDGVDVPGGSVSVSLPSGAAGQYTYVALANPIALAANTSYYLVSQETAGGDQWYDVGPVAPASVAVVNSAVYWTGFSYFSLGVPNSSYVPVNLLYTGAGAGPSVSVTAPAAGAALSGNVTVSATATAGGGLAIASVQFKVDGANQGAPVTSSPYSIALDTTKLTNGTHSLSAVAADSASNATTSTALTVTVANPPSVSITAPAAGATVSGSNVTVTASAAAALGATIGGVQFKVDGTNQGAPVTSSPYSIVLDAGSMTSGPHTLTAVATDSANIVTTSAPVSITVDNTTTTAAITAPAAGASVSGNVTVSATAIPRTGATIASVQFKVDNVSQGAPVSTSPYRVTLNTTTLTNGTHTLTAVATDSASAAATSAPVSVTVANPPTVSITAPVAGATVTGNVTVSATATAALGATVGSVQFKVDGINKGAPVTSAPYGFVLDTTTLANGPHSLTAVATDSANNTATSSPVSITVTSVPTTVSISAPAAGATVSGNVTVSATASPGTGLTISNVQFKVDGANQGAPVTASPYSITLNTTALTNGAHTLAAVATDSTNNAIPSASVTIIIANPPAVSVTAPATGATVTGNVTVSATAAAALGATISSVQFKVDGNNQGAPVTTRPYSVVVNTAALASGPHTLTAVATDSASNAATSSPVAITVGVVAPPAPAYVTGFTPSSLRNNFTGWVGMQFTVGTTQLTVSSLGRIYVAGNTRTHAVKLVRASDGSDVPGGSTTISLPAGTAGQFAYAQLAAAVTLAANTSYYLVSQETLDADQWYDIGNVTPSNVATVKGPVYWNGFDWIQIAGANSSYVPLNFSYATATPPTVSITAPAANATVSGSNVTVSATATAASGLAISSVQFKVDGVNSGAAVTASPYNTVLDATKLSNGAHSLTAVATDTAGISTTSSGLNVTVNNPVPTVTISAPASGATVSGNNVTVSATATPGSGLTISGVQFKLDNVNYGAAITTSPYNIVLDATKLINGAHTLTAVATDSGNNAGVSAAVNITIANPLPTVAITAPAPGAILTTNGTLSATATAGAGLTVASVQFKVDSSNQGPAVTISPYTAAFDISKVANGAHTIAAVVTDSAGNSVTSAAVNVTVNNPGPPAGTALLSGFTLGTLRNNFTGWVGMRFTVGSTALNVTALGRLYLSGNSGSHVVKLARASDGSDVPGASVSISLPSGTAGQFAYAPLASPVTLPANTSYYLVSAEAINGDLWDDYNPVTPTSAVSVNGPVYSNGPALVSFADANRSYVPVNLQYNTSSGTPSSISITAPAAGATVSGSNVTISATVTAGTGVTIANVQFNIDNANLGAAVNSSPYTSLLDTTKFANGAHALTAVLTDSANNVVSSAPVSITINNPTPAIAITAPTAGTVSGSVTLSATATAGAGLAIANVQFKVDNANQGAAVTAIPYSIVLDATKLTNGAHSLTAIATDSAGNSTTSAPVAITVIGGKPVGNALITGFIPGGARNNFTGPVGMQFTVGSTALSVTALGRIYIAGNTGSHLVKLVRASDGADVPGGSVTVSPASGTPGQFTYAQLASPVTLAANTPYFLASQETSGGDQWYDIGPVTATSAVSISGPVYWNGFVYFLVGSPSTSYVPLSLQYTAVP